MFTGIIEETGFIKSIVPFGNGLRIQFAGDKVFGDLKIDDSIAINGVCQTVTAINGKFATVEAVEETLKRTTFVKLSPNQRVNLERAMLPTTRMGGHIVQGHVDTVGAVHSINRLHSSTLITIQFPEEYRKYVLEKGSICLDGVSLTISEVSSNSFTVAVIPHTIANTILSEYQIGRIVNLEFDILGKYIENLLLSQTKSEPKPSFLESFIDQPKW